MSSIIHILQLPQTTQEEDITAALVALLTSAVHDENPDKSLSDVHKIIVNNGGTSYLDPLNMIPLLVPVNDPSATEIATLVAECGSAKEAVIAVQEVIEKIERSLQDEELFEDENQKKRKLVDQLILAIELYASAIPRIKLRRKTAVETVQPLLTDLCTLFKLAGPSATNADAISIVTSSVRLSNCISSWTVIDTDEARSACRLVVKSFLEEVVFSCVTTIRSDIAQRTFKECFPRLTFRSAPRSDEDETELALAAISSVLDEFRSLNTDLHSVSGKATLGHLIAAAHDPQPVDSLKLIAFLLPVLLSSLNTNTFLDESLAILLRSLHTATSSAQAKITISPEISIPLVSLLPTLASGHPDSDTRHQAFRVLSLLLRAEDQRLRFQHLLEMTTDAEFPQMRVAAVGLVKEAVLEALAATSVSHLGLSTESGNPGDLAAAAVRKKVNEDNPFLNTDLLLGDTLDLETFQESSEPARLVQCLSFYYVLLMRDQVNLTGIRDKDIQKTIDGNLLKPLGRYISRWLASPSEQPEEGHSHDHDHDFSAVVALQIGLERIETAKQEIDRAA